MLSGGISGCGFAAGIAMGNRWGVREMNGIALGDDSSVSSAPPCKQHQQEFKDYR